jgi:hypothetical protein
MYAIIQKKSANMLNRFALCRIQQKQLKCIIIKGESMTGYKTWIAVLSSIGTGVYLYLNGNQTEGVASVLYGLGLLGIGGKLSKIEKK